MLRKLRKCSTPKKEERAAVQEVNKEPPGPQNMLSSSGRLTEGTQPVLGPGTNLWVTRQKV